MRQVLIFNDVLPSDLRAALRQEAEECERNLNDQAVCILSKAYGVPWEETEHTRYRDLHGVRFKIRVSPELHLAMRMDAAEHGATLRGLVLLHLAEHYGLDPISPGRKPRRKATV